MADSPRVVSPRLSVTLDDGAVHEVQTLNPDLVRWERTAAKHSWPAATLTPMTWLTFIAWSALRREKAIPEDLTWETFSDTRCLSVENLDADEDAGRPTPPGADPG